MNTWSLSRRSRIPPGVRRSPTRIVTFGALTCLLLTGCGTSARLAARRGSHQATARHTVVLGRSVEQRPIRVEELGEAMAARRVLVVGCIHGNERAGIAVARRIQSMSMPPGVALWVLEDLNPDGAAAGTRQNARGVDLNRNFPYHWRPAGRPGDQQYPGPRALSEPEARIAHQLVLRVRPQITIYFHQPLGVVDESGGDPRVERRFARLTGLPLRRLTRYDGSAVGWQNHSLRHTTAFVVELRPGRLSPLGAARFAKAIVALAGTARAQASG